MGFPSYFENIIERQNDNLFMRGRLWPERHRLRSEIAASVPSQPSSAMTMPSPPLLPDFATFAERGLTQQEKHVLALLELRPGKAWRH